MTWIFYLFAFCAIFQTLYYGIFFGRFAFSKATSPENNLKINDLPPVSVIICARNEAENLKENLSFIAQQNYPNKFEIIVVNDRSTDESNLIIESFSKKYPYIKQIAIEDIKEGKQAGKKYALSKGISHSKFKHLIFTDADCRPTSFLWLERIARNFTNATEIVLGYGPYRTFPGFLNKCIQYETLMTAAQYFSHFWWKIPYMGIGRNLAYTKDLVDNSLGIKKYENILSGDDDLFIMQVANGKNTKIEISVDSFCYSNPPIKWADWFNQKSRHLSTGKYYKTLHKVTLGGFAATQVFFYILLPFTLQPNLGLEFVIYLATVKFLVQGFILFRIGRMLDCSLNTLQLLLFDFVFVLYYSIFGLISRTNKFIKWK